MKTVKRQEVLTMESINKLLEEGECFYVEREEDCNVHSDADRSS